MMRLRRIASYRLNRILAGILPVIIAVLIAIPAWDYWKRAQEARPQGQQPGEFPQDIAVRTEGFNVTRSEGGRKIFTVNAQVTVGFKDNKRLGQNVDVEIFPARDGDPVRHIRADECSYDETTDDVFCTRNVKVRFDEDTLGRTEQLTYNHAGRVISSNVRTDLEQPGQMTGDAGRLDYFMDPGLLRLSDQVHILLTSGGSLRSGAAVFQRKENWATVSQGIELDSPNGRIRGASGRAELQPGTYRPTQITVEGSVVAESAKPQDTPKAPSGWTMQSHWMQSDLSADGNIRHVLARGEAEVHRMISGGEETLEGSEIEAHLDAAGRVNQVEARQSPVFTSGERLLTAEQKIVIDPEGKVTTEGASTLRSGASAVIEGRDFSIEQKGNAREFRTSHRAVLTSGALRTEGDTTVAQLDPGTNQLRELVQTGKVRFKQEAREGEAGRITVTENGNSVRLEQAGRITDSQNRTTLAAQRITLNQETRMVDGEGSVVVTDNRSQQQPLRVTAGRVRASDKTVEYWDKVKLVRGDAKVDADHIVANTGESGFHADGNVWFRAGVFETRSDILDFTSVPKSVQRATFQGKVRAQKKDPQGIMILETSDMDVVMKPGDRTEVDTIEAKGGVRVTQGIRSGEGVEAEYKASTGQITLRGSETVDAVARGPEGETRGFIIQTNPDGRVASVLPSKISGSVKTSTDKPKK